MTTAIREGGEHGVVCGCRSGQGARRHFRQKSRPGAQGDHHGIPVQEHQALVDEDNSLDALQEEEEEKGKRKGGNEMEDEDHVEPGQDFMDLFDTREDGNGDKH